MTTGTFDGVHLGHKKILKRLIENAREMGRESVLLTFYPHPRIVLHPKDHGLKLLSTQEEKAELLKEMGLDHLIELPFSKEFASLSPREYVRKVLVEAIGIEKIIVGYDHRFGNHREGDYNKLLEYGEIYNFDVEQISALELQEIKISSTKIRQALESGDVEKAAQFLGHTYAVKGTVVKGQSLGSKIGFPTANVLPEYDWKLIPGNGVYTVKCEVEGKIIPGILNIGTRPTVNKDNKVVIEVHLLDWDGLIYDKKINIKFLYRIREEQKFDSIEDLVEQINKDKAQALEQLK